VIRLSPDLNVAALARAFEAGGQRLHIPGVLDAADACALVFHARTATSSTAWVPAFNALNLFVVPTRHAVTQVASFAAKDRLSIVGWLRSNRKVGLQARGETSRY